MHAFSTALTAQGSQGWCTPTRSSRRVGGSLGEQ